MSRFDEIQKQLDELSPIPSNMPKLYLLGDTGAGKTSIVRRILGTEKFCFPSVRDTCTTVAVTEYVISRKLSYQATYIFKSRESIENNVGEILHVAISGAYANFRKGSLNKCDVKDKLDETPDQRFRLNYLMPERLEDLAGRIVHFMPLLDSAVKELALYLQSSDDEEDEVVDLVLKQDCHHVVSDMAYEILKIIESRVAEVCDGYDLFAENGPYQHSSDSLVDFVERAKRVLSSAKNSISPVIEHARLQGDLLASWLPSDAEVVLIDGEGIGHDAKEVGGGLSVRHLDYFYMADAVVLVEGCKQAFKGGGKNVLEGIVRNGYIDRFHLVFTKMDEMTGGDDEEPSWDDRIREIRKRLANVESSLKGVGVKYDAELSRSYFFSNMKGDGVVDESSAEEVKKLLRSVNASISEAEPEFVRPIYEYGVMLPHLSSASERFLSRWNDVLCMKHWQTIKAFNRRMCWREDGFRELTPIADFHMEVMREMGDFLSRPDSWAVAATHSAQEWSIEAVKREFSKRLLRFSRELIVGLLHAEWVVAVEYSGAGSAEMRRHKIRGIFCHVSRSFCEGSIKDIIESSGFVDL